MGLSTFGTTTTTTHRKERHQVIKSAR